VLSLQVALSEPLTADDFVQLGRDQSTYCSSDRVFSREAMASSMEAVS
jgi:hypothetical protein